MSNKVWDKISYAQSAANPTIEEHATERLVALSKENERLKQQLGDAAMQILKLERKLTEAKAT